MTMRGLRQADYLYVVLDTVKQALPVLVAQLRQIQKSL